MYYTIKCTCLLGFFTVEGGGGSANETGLQVTLLPQKKASPPAPVRGRGRPRGSTIGI